MSDAGEPFRLLRLAVAALLLFGTVVAIILAVTGLAPRALLLLGAFWALYGLVLAFVDGILEPVIDLTVTMFQNIGLVRAGGGYSAIETLVARGLYDAAAGDYLERAHQGAGDAEAMVRRAALLAGPLENAPAAALELENFRNARTLRPTEDIRLGLALAQLYEHRLEQPGQAMAELRRLIDRYPSSRHVRMIRRSLAGLKQHQFGGL